MTEQAKDTASGPPSLVERLEQGFVVCAEGYVFELERRGYLQAGAYVPEVVLEHPEVVQQLHRDFVHAGSDVVEAITYYAHREKLRVIGREQDLESLNREALELAKAVARETDTLFAGNICNTNAYLEADVGSHRAVRSMFDEQVAWISDVGADYVVAETFAWAKEALIAIELIKQAGLPVVATLAIHHEGRTFEGMDSGRGLPQARGRRGRGGRGWTPHPRPAHDAATDRRDQSRRLSSRRRAARAVPDDGTRSQPSRG